jgi:hypothetical protein
MASTTLTVAVSTKAWAAAVKVAERLVGPDDSYTPVDVVADAVCQFRAEVGRDPLDMVELQRHADGEDVDTTPVEVLTVASLREMLMVRGLKGASGMTKAGLVEYLKTGDRPAKAAPKAGTVADLRAQCKARGLKGYTTMDRARLESYLATGERPEAAPPKPGTAGDYRAQLKGRGLKGYSGLRKDALVEYASTGVRPAKPAPNAGTCDWMRAALKGKGVKGYSGKNRADLLALCEKHGIAV